jgi:predicted ATPase
MIRNQQYRRLMNEYTRTGNITKSAQLADMSRPTARKYLEAKKGPAEVQAKHTWRTRPDPLAAVWPEAEKMLEEAPELEAKALFEHLQGRHGEALAEKHLRTFQRRVQQWRMRHGPDKEVFFPQDWEPGRALQLDWTHASELGVSIQGQPYGRLLCHLVLRQP